MTASFEDYDLAIRAFWKGRDLQTQKQIESGKVDAGNRGSVTGGRHLTALQDLVAGQFEPLIGLGANVRKSGIIPLPGYYRRAKNWDIVITCRNVLVAAIECKSQAGSFGNNFNNRTEEAIGNAVDLWRAYEAGLVGTVSHGWASYSFSNMRPVRHVQLTIRGHLCIEQTPPLTTRPTRRATNCFSSGSSASGSTMPRA